MSDKKSWDFPQYRKYKELNTWYKISGINEFSEIKQVGEGYLMVKVEAQIYPEKLRVQDMLNCHEGRWEELSEEEWQKVANLIEV